MENKELIVWLQIDVKDELPNKTHYYNIIDKNGHIGTILYNADKKIWHSDNAPSITHWLKRVVIPILSDQEINNVKHSASMDSSFIQGYKAGYKAKQLEFIKSINGSE